MLGHPRHLLVRRGYSLLDTLAAGTVMAIVLVPAYSTMQRGLAWSRVAEVQQVATTLCIAKIEEHLAIVAGSFTPTTDAGNYSADGFADFKFSVNCSDSATDGGIPDRLMAITVTVWKDEDGDGIADADETQTTLTTNVAKMATYMAGV